MAFQISNFSISPSQIGLGTTISITTQYNIDSNATNTNPLTLTAKYVGKGGVAIVGTFNFTHNNITQNSVALKDTLHVTINHPPATPFSPQIELTCTDALGQNETTSVTLFVVPPATLVANFDKLHINNFKGSKNKAYKLLKDSGFQYNNLTKLWEK